jgi:N-acetylglutamate synthase
VNIAIVPMTIGDYEEAVALWRVTPGIGLNQRDEFAPFARYLTRHAGLSQVARAGQALAGVVLAGHDERRGYLHHMAVAPEYRKRGIGRQLVARSLEALAEVGIDTCHCFVHAGNADGQLFWKSLGWTPRDDLTMMTHRPST